MNSEFSIMIYDLPPDEYLFLNTNDHKWPVNFREYFLTECFWSHAESAEDAENALLRSHGFRDEGLFV